MQTCILVNFVLHSRLGGHSSCTPKGVNALAGVRSGLQERVVLVSGELLPGFGEVVQLQRLHRHLFRFSGCAAAPAAVSRELETMIFRAHRSMREFVQELKNFEINPYETMIDGFVKPNAEDATLPEKMWADFQPETAPPPSP